MYQHRIFGLDLNPRNVVFAGVVAAFSFLTLADGSSARAEAGAAKVKTPAVARSCQVAYQSAQEKEKAGQLVEAHKLYRSCSDLGCGTSVWAACIQANTLLHATLPSIVPVAIDDRGAPRADVEVKMDGQVIASALTGLSIPVDPGEHEFSFSTGSGVFATTKISIVEGERNRILSVSSPAAESGHQRLASTTRN
ncbi:MAG TPA: hypothetical protein VFH68_16075 [Polyangia bacterium]|jgi:hypothetical protein|nr:hypothetical protein [Polyangia bacterium]